MKSELATESKKLLPGKRLAVTLQPTYRNCLLVPSPEDLKEWADYSLRLSTTLLFQCISMTFILEWKKESSGPRKAV